MIKNFEKMIIDEISESMAVKKSLLDPKTLKTIAKISDEVIKAYNRKNKIIWFGNGGSAADAQHLACELISGFEIRDRKPIRSISLTTNTSILTAVANDFSFDRVFKRQIEALVDKNDVVIGISTSGNSPNVIEALKMAKEMKAITIGITGQDGGKVKDVVDILLNISSTRTRMIQEACMTAGHTICYLVEQELFGDMK